MKHDDIIGSFISATFDIMFGPIHKPVSHPDWFSCPCGSDAAVIGEYYRVNADGSPDNASDDFLLNIRCGDCGEWRTAIAHEDVCSRFESLVIDGYVQPMHRQAEKLDREVFEAQADAFALALERDLIDANDFCRHSA